jgi:tyrosine-protein kinase Etk/Wzc
MKSIVAVGSTRGASGRSAQSLRDEVRYLWSRLQLHLPPARGQVLRLGFCSTHPGEGTTSVAANFSIFLGEQGRKTCLVEANLRHPTLADHFGVARSPGMCEYLDGTADLTEAIRGDVAPLVDLVPAGVAPRDIYAALGNGGIGNLLEAVRETGEVLVIDAPPLSAAPEAAPILRSLDATVLVVQAQSTRRRAVEKSLATFDDLGIPLCGIVLNRVSYDLPSFIESLL